MADFRPPRLVEIANLQLDRKNPRLPSRLRGADDNAIIEYLARKTNIADLIASISANGFFPGESIVVTKSADNADAADNAGQYIVLEGNRRLTALKLLQDESLARSISPSIGDAVRRAETRPTAVPVYEVDNREEALQYLGFRHVSGVQRWDPLAKARYLEMLYQDAGGDPESRYGQIAREIGSRRDTVRKNLDALAAYGVVERNSFFDIPTLDEDRFQFGTFYTALANPKIAEFTGARDPSQRIAHPIVNPEVLNVEAIEELVHWMFEKRADGTTRLGESRNIHMLADVVAAPNALKRFREGAMLREAHLATPDIQNEFVRDIRIATTHVRAANTKLDSVTPDDPEVQDCIFGLGEQLKVTTETLGIPLPASAP